MIGWRQTQRAEKRTLEVGVTFSTLSTPIFLQVGEDRLLLSVETAERLVRELTIALVTVKT